MKCYGSAFRPATGACAEPVVAVLEDTYRADGKVTHRLACLGHKVGTLKYVRTTWRTKTTYALPLSAYRPELDSRNTEVPGDN
jgi:hypothetical protein